jgi:mandelate racemase
VPDLDSGLTIRGVRAGPLELELARPIETAAGAIRTAPIVMIDLTTEEGVTGHSYVRSYSPVALGPLADLVANLAGLVEGDPALPAAVEEKLQRHLRLLGAQGLVLMAIAGIDMAIWDAQARAAGVPLVTLLGGDAGPVPAYAALRTMSPAGASAEAEEAVAAGFEAVKVKVGRGDLAADLETVRAVRRAVGDDVDLMVDYNQCLSVCDAIERARSLDDEGVHWIEEPTRADDYEGHARIAAAARTPIQLGESFWGPNDLEKSIAARASDHVTLDVMKLGGVSAWLRAAALAEAAGLPASSHTFPEFSAHLLAVTPTRHRLEYLDHAAPILREPVRIENGNVVIPADRPGGGVEWDDERAERLAAGSKWAARDSNPDLKD